MLVFFLLAFGALLGVPIVIGMYYAVRYGLDVEPVRAPQPHGEPGVSVAVSVR